MTTPTSEEARETVLDNARTAVMSDRNTDYGNPEDNFEDIASLWRAWHKMGGDVRDNETTATDVAVMMILVKIARLKTSPLVEDHWTDIAGYAACGYAASLADDERFAERQFRIDSERADIEAAAADKRQAELLKDFGELTKEDFEAIRRARADRRYRKNAWDAGEAVRTRTHTPRAPR